MKCRPSGVILSQFLVREDILPFLTCMTLGFLFGIWPHILAYLDTGSPMWVASNDELNFYMKYTTQAYFHHPWKLGDPALPEGGISHFPNWQFVPAILVAKWFGLGPIAIPFLWRILASLLLPISLFLFVRSYLRHGWLTSIIVILFLTDHGAIWGKPALGQLRDMLATVKGSEHEVDTFYHQWRIITPAISFWTLLLFVTMLTKHLFVPGNRSLHWAAAGFALLFYSYFYYWSAACFGIVLLGLLMPKYWKSLLQVGVIGGFLGLPAILYNYNLKANAPEEWLSRQGYFLKVPEVTVHPIPWGFVIIFLLALTWAMLRHRDLLPLACTAFAAWLLARFQSSITHIVIQDGHWSYVSNFGLWLLMVLLVAREFQFRWTSESRQRKPMILILTSVTLIWVVFGFHLRTLERSRNKESVLVQSRLDRWREQIGPDIIPEFVSVVVAGDDDFCVTAAATHASRPLSTMIFMCASIDNVDWHRRSALEGWLRGMSRNEFLDWQERLFSGEGMEGKSTLWSYVESLKNEAIQERLDYFDAVMADPQEWLTRYEVELIALPVSQTIRPELSPTWELIYDGPHWNIWRTNPPKSG